LVRTLPCRWLESHPVTVHSLPCSKTPLEIGTYRHIDIRMLFASASVSISCALQPFSKLPVPTALLFGFNSLCSDRGPLCGTKCSCSVAVVQPIAQLSPPNGLQYADVLAHTSGDALSASCSRIPRLV